MRISQKPKQRFYLNYVGCKDEWASEIIELLRRFTLTMWDVKYTYEEMIELNPHRFTLTMWDVKRNHFQIMKLRKLVLP